MGSACAAGRSRDPTARAASRLAPSFHRLAQPVLPQGDIEAVASKSPAALTELFEQISGSGSLKRRYEELEAAKSKAEEALSLLFSKKKNVTMEKRQKKEQKDEAEKYLAMQEELVRVARVVCVWGGGAAAVRHPADVHARSQAALQTPTPTHTRAEHT